MKKRLFEVWTCRSRGMGQLSGAVTLHEAYAKIRDYEATFEPGDPYAVVSYEIRVVP